MLSQESILAKLITKRKKMEVLVGLGMLTVFVVIALKRQDREDDKKGYCDL